MNRYEELKNRFQQEINAFPMKWAFSKEQFDRSMQELGLDPADTDKIIGIPGGGFIRKSDKKAFIELFSRREKAVEAAIAEDVDGSGFVCPVIIHRSFQILVVMRIQSDDSCTALDRKSVV